MAKTYEGSLNAKGLKFCIIVSRFNDFISRRLLDGALDALVRSGADDADIAVVRVPGSLEIPATTMRLAKSGKYDAFICLGAVIRGGTPHFDYVSAEVTKGVAQVALDTTLPITMGIITADTLDQAVDRAGAKSGNKGHDAAISAIELANLYREMPG